MNPHFLPRRGEEFALSYTPRICHDDRVVPCVGDKATCPATSAYV
jgi:hypothetical protein